MRIRDCAKQTLDRLQILFTIQGSSPSRTSAATLVGPHLQSDGTDDGGGNDAPVTNPGPLPMPCDDNDAGDSGDWDS